MTTEGFKAAAIRSDGLEKQINELTDATAQGFQKVEERFQKVDEHFDNLHKEMNEREEKFV